MSVHTTSTAPTLRVTVRTPGGSAAAVLARFGDAYAGVLAFVGPGQALVQVHDGGSTSTATLPIGPAQTTPSAPPAARKTGVVAAEAAGDVAVGLQRIGDHTAQVTLIAPSGAGIPRALVLVGDRTAEPCPGQVACYSVPVPASGGPLAVKVIRPGGATVTTRVDLPAANVPATPGLVGATARAFHGLESVMSHRVLASSPTQSVTTTFVSQAPDRVSVDVQGGQQQIVIGNTQYIQQPDGSWKTQSLGPGGGTRVPDPFWAPRAIAAHLIASSAKQKVMTLVIPGTRADPVPTFFRLWIDPRTNVVQHLRMITSAHFMTEVESHFNSAPPVVAPR